MNVEKVTDMPAGGEMDVLIARRVVGLEWDPGQWLTYAPQYSTDIMMALTVLPHITHPDPYEPVMIRITGPFQDGWYTELIWDHHDGEIVMFTAGGETLPLAICRLALLAAPYCTNGDDSPQDALSFDALPAATGT